MAAAPPAAPHIAVVDDEPDLREAVATYLGRQGFEVSEAANGDALATLMAERPVDLVVLDVNMPGEDGLSIARRLRETSRVLIVMLTANGGVIDRVTGLEVGADDYLAKPFEPRELLARVRAVLRRARESGQPRPAGSETATASREVQVGRCTLDLDGRRLLGPDREPMPLTAMEFDLLRLFVENPGRVLSRDRILDLAHNREMEAFDRSVDLRVVRLRRKVEENPAAPQAIKTVRGAGYVFTPQADNR